MDSLTAKLGFWSALVAFLGAAAYTVAQIMSPPLLPLLIFPWNLILIIAPSLVLAFAFLVAMNCVSAYAPGEKKLWSRIGVSFATVYATLAGFVYIIQLAVVIPFTIKGLGNQVMLFNITSAQPASQWIPAVDALGYCSMSLATLFTFPVFATKGFERWVRRFFLLHGLLAPVVILPLWIPPLLLLGALWFITAPVALLLLTLFFKNLPRQP